MASWGVGMNSITFKYWKQDFTSGAVVFLVALPLCLGIALASGAPLFSGIISGMIAGTIVAYLSGSELSISGPAAGLTVIVINGIGQQGGFENFLPALVIAGCVQVLLGALKAGQLSSLVPTSVMRGMMAAIGITIIIRQVPYALGAWAYFENDFVLWNFVSLENAVKAIQDTVSAVHWTAVTISLVSLFVYAVWDNYFRKREHFMSFVPGALIAVVVGTVINQLFSLHDPGLALYAKDGHLVHLPNIDSFHALVLEFRNPNWAMLSQSKTWSLGLAIAVVASVESLLCIEATDRQDPQHRISQTSTELVAQGIGNTLCGFIGGIPIASVLLRSSTNVFAGAQTRLSGLFQGVFLMVSVLFFAGMINMVPLASLASILIIVGYRLTNHTVFRKVLGEGTEQYIPFFITVVAILSTDLLKGIGIGFCSAALLIIWTSYYSSIQVVSSGSDYLIKFTKDVTFIHRVKLKRELMALPEGSKLVIDGSRTLYIDHDIYSTIEDFRWVAEKRNISIELVEVENKSFSRMATNMIKARSLKGKKYGKLQKTASKQ